MVIRALKLIAVKKSYAASEIMHLFGTVFTNTPPRDSECPLDDHFHAHKHASECDI